MRLTAPIRQILNNQTLEALKRSVSKAISDATPHIQAAKENQIKILSQKFTDLNNWYMKITGLDKVHLAQEKVTALQGQLLQIQEKRRDVGKQLSEIRQKSMELQDEIHKVKRQEDLEKFLDLMKKETEVMKLEKSISKTFQDYDQTERELFTAFTDSIRDSHEKQRAQMEYTKYLSIILSIAGSFLAFIYTTIRKQQLKNIIHESLQNVNLYQNQNGNNESFIPELMNTNKIIMQEITNNRKKLSDFSSAVAKKFAELEQGSGINNPSSVFQDTSVAATNHYDNKGFFGENTNYVQIFGVVLGLWLVAKVLSG